MFEPFVDFEQGFDEYIRRMRSPPVWGGQIELQAMSLMYRVNIRILSTQNLDEGPSILDNGFEREVILCFSHGNHYDCIYTEEQHNDAGWCQGIIYDLVDVLFGEGKGQGASSSKSNSDQKQEYKNVEYESWRVHKKAMEEESAKLMKRLYADDRDAFYASLEAEESGTGFRDVKPRKNARNDLGNMEAQVGSSKGKGNKNRGNKGGKKGKTDNPWELLSQQSSNSTKKKVEKEFDEHGNVSRAEGEGERGRDENRCLHSVTAIGQRRIPDCRFREIGQ
eukprot:TRINITY_DN4010_c0_g2_i1.p1 TRINITY_DN4010_c0_g2~~TRINITY_DN4010_c0_g2_i1.p1  ORF type:complete len:315 (+),score=85.13 TRINITY_DN4010_c0_g2_i1:111-947(+)